MARSVRDAALVTRSARLRLSARTKPYWRLLAQGLHLGSRRRATGGSWIARRRDDNGNYHEEKLGRADDLQDADDASILSSRRRSARRETGGPIISGLLRACRRATTVPTPLN